MSNINVNRVILSGNVVRNAELRQDANGSSILTFSVASNDRRRNKQTGEWESHPNFIDCAMFGKRAEAVHSWVTKGIKVTIDGHLSYSTWEGKDGQRHSRLSVIVDNLDIHSPHKADSAGNTSVKGPAHASTPQGKQPFQGNSAGQQADNPYAGYAEEENVMYDQDIPF